MQWARHWFEGKLWKCLHKLLFWRQIRIRSHHRHSRKTNKIWNSLLRSKCYTLIKSTVISITLANTRKNNFKNRFKLLVLTPISIYQNHLWRFETYLSPGPTLGEGCNRGQDLGIFQKLSRQLWCFLLVESLILGRLGHFGIFGPLFGGVGSFSCRFISCSEELGLRLFGCLFWVFFPQWRVSLLHLFFDSLLLPWAFTWGLGLCCFWGLQSWKGLSLLPTRCVGTRTLYWRLLSCGMFLYLRKRRKLSLGKKENQLTV